MVGFALPVLVGLLAYVAFVFIVNLLPQFWADIFLGTLVVLFIISIGAARVRAEETRFRLIRNVGIRLLKR